MYDRMVDEPRLTAWYGKTLLDPSLPEIVPAMAAALSDRYDRTFDGVGAACYRDGRDSVAWHGDRIPLEIVDPVVALVSLGFTTHAPHAQPGAPPRHRGRGCCSPATCS